MNISDKFTNLTSMKPYVIFPYPPKFLEYREPLLEDINKLVRSLLTNYLLNKNVITFLPVNDEGMFVYT